MSSYRNFAKFLYYLLFSSSIFLNVMSLFLSTKSFAFSTSVCRQKVRNIHKTMWLVGKKKNALAAVRLVVEKCKDPAIVERYAKWAVIASEWDQAVYGYNLAVQRTRDTETKEQLQIRLRMVQQRFSDYIRGRLLSGSRGIEMNTGSKLGIRKRKQIYQQACPVSQRRKKEKLSGSKLGVRVPSASIDTQIQFDYNSTHVRSENVPILRIVADALKPHIQSGACVLIIGHTDGTGSLQGNQKLSQQRAISVSRMFEKYGLNRQLLHSEGMASLHPIATNDTPEGRQRNRRVEFRILNSQ